MNISFHLYQAQKVDLQLSAIDKRLTDIDILLMNDTEIKTSKKRYEEVLTSLKKASQDLKEIEYSINTKRNKLEQSESSLYSGTIKNPKELQDLQKEILSLKNAVSKLEEQELDQMLVVEELEVSLDRTQKEHEITLANNEKKNQILYIEKNNLFNQKNILSTERAVIMSQLTPQKVSVYDELRKRKNGVAVAKIDDQTCTLCGNSLTPAECQSVKTSTDLIFCPSCGRILYCD